MCGTVSAGLRSYLKAFRFSSASSEDLVQHLGDAVRKEEEEDVENNILPKGVSMSQVLQAWYNLILQKYNGFPCQRFVLTLKGFSSLPTLGS